MAGARLAFAFAMLSRSAGTLRESGPANSQRFHQPNCRRIICRSGGGLCRIKPLTGRCAAIGGLEEADLLLDGIHGTTVDRG